MRKQEMLAWAKLTVLLIAIGYLWWHLFGGASPPMQDEDAWEPVRSRTVYGLYTLLIVVVLVRKYGHGVDKDERDEWISSTAAKSALAALSLMILLAAMIAGMDEYAGCLAARSGGWIELFLILCVLMAWCVEAAVRIYHYRYDPK